MIILFMQYILPFLMFALILSAAALRTHWGGGSAMLLIVFFLVAFGPSLLYALIADDSSGVLFGVSIAAAFLAVALFVKGFYRKK